jgi:excisionase family DNA binding protein
MGVLLRPLTVQGTDEMDKVTGGMVGPVLSVREVAIELRCSISFVYKLMSSGELSFERRGRRKLPVAISVADYRQRNLVEPGTADRLKPPPVRPRRYRHLFNGRER